MAGETVNIEQQFRNSRDEYYRNTMANITGRLQTIAISEEFQAALDGKDLNEIASEKEMAKQARERKENYPYKKYESENEKTQKAVDDLMDITLGLRDSYGAAPRIEVQKKLLAENKEKEITRQAAKMRLKGFRKGYKLFDYIYKNKDEQGQRYLEAMKKAAVANGIPISTLYDDLQYIDEKLKLGLQLEKWQPEAVVGKTTIPGERSWDNYAAAHLQNVPHTLKGKEEYLAKAMAGAFNAEHGRMKPADAEKFSTKAARNYAEKIQAMPAFKQMCKEPLRVRALIEAGKKDPKTLFDTTVRMHRPFYKMDQSKMRETLKKLKQMEPLLDSSEGSSSKWKKLKESIRTINPDDPKGAEKLQEILDNTCGYMKGIKKLRGNEHDRKQFDQSLDILSVLSEGSDYAKYSAQAVVDRINEVRRGADRNYDPISLSEYGAAHLSAHTNSPDMNQIREYEKAVRTSEYKPAEKEKLVRYGSDKLPADPSELIPWTKNIKGHPDGFKSTIAMYKEFASGKEMNAMQIKNDLGVLLAVADSQLYYMKNRETGHSTIVYNQDEILMKNMQLMNDPAVDELAKQYAEHPEKRLALTALIPGENKDDPNAERSGDVKTLDLSQLKKDYEEAKKSLEKQAQPGL